MAKRLLEQGTDIVGISISQKTVIGASSIGFVSSLADINWAAFISVVVAILGLIFNTYFQWRNTKKREELIKAQLQALKKGEVIKNEIGD